MKEKKLSLGLLTALVLGNMVGVGIFMLPRSLAEVASPLAILWAWILTGTGVLMLALVFGNLAIRRKDINGGPQLYAKALFPEHTKRSTFAGFLASWGYWVANWVGNVAVITAFTTYLSTFFPILNSTQVAFAIGHAEIHVGNVLSFIVCTLLIWASYFFVLRGIEEAGKFNFAATAAKIAGFVIFIILALTVFEYSHIVPLNQSFTEPAGKPVGLLSQVNQAAVLTLWAFIGVESAMVFAGRAKRVSDVKKATVLGLLIAVTFYIIITFLAIGALPKELLLATDKPLVEVMQLVLGDAGAYIMAGLGLISLAGSMIGWVLLSAEVPYQAARLKVFPPVFRKVNKQGTPVFALLCTSIMMQILVFSVISKTMASFYNFLILIATLASLIPYLIAVLFQLKLVWTGETYEKRRQRVVDGIIAAFACIYAVWIIVAGTADWRTFGLGVILIGLGLFVYPWVHEKK